MVLKLITKKIFNKFFFKKIPYIFDSHVKKLKPFAISFMLELKLQVKIKLTSI